MRKSMVLAVVVIAAVFVGLSACVEDSGMGAPLGRTQSRIVGGSSYDGLPAVGALTYDGYQHCSGTLIGPRKVVTAAHCVSGFSASRMQFVTGPSLGSAQTATRVASMQAHPSYNASAITNDIAVVTLASDVPVEPLPVLTSMDSSWAGTQLFFVGYGVDNGYNQTGAGVKRAVWMAISQVSSTTFRYDDTNHNTCSGDSGGPAFYRDANGTYYVAGVTSYGDAYCTRYGVDTRVDAYLSFLDVDASMPEEPEEPAADPCQGETWEGRCDGETVVWCENEQVYRQDCAADGKVCTYDFGHQYYGCGEPPQEPADPCQGETWEGRCDGDTVVWCENEQVYREDCDAEGKVCSFDSEKGYYACRMPEPVDPCNGETWDGRCENGSVIWCEDDQVKSINCQAGGASCGYSSSKGYYDCI